MTLRLFLDTEFTDLLDCELLSVGIVSTDGEEFYAELSDVDLGKCGDFARVAVLPQLNAPSVRRGTEEDVSRWLVAWMEQFRPHAPVYVSVDHPTDWEFFSYLVRDAETLKVPAWIVGQSISRAVEARDVEAYWMANGRRAHHALHDAHAMRFAFHQHLRRQASSS